MHDLTDSKSIRKEMRAKRQRLTPREQRDHSLSAFRNLRKSGLILRFKRIAAYFSDRGELAPELYFETLWRYRKTIVLPVLHPVDKNRMLFVRYERGDELVANRFGILEPRLKPRKVIPSHLCGLVLCPLTAFDESGRRLGMGGGFYDRSFAFKLKSERSLPRLAGMAYEFQKVPEITTQAWDVSLDCVVTEKRYYLPRKNKR